MAFSGDRIPDLLDLAIWTDQKSTAHDALENLAHESLGAPHSVFLNHFVLGVAEQRKIQFLFVPEIYQRFLRIGADAQDGHVLLVETSFCVAKLGRFGGSTGGVGFRIEKHHHTFSLVVLQ